MRNLIGKRIGIDDHFPCDYYTRIMFKDAEEYLDIIRQGDENQDEEYGLCIKNQYKSDEWIKAWIKCEANKHFGKDYSYYVYNVDYDGVSKPTKKYVDDESVLYQRANGVMYYDFDHIGKDIVKKIKNIFLDISKEHKVFQWFETSWSGKGCHIRINYNLKFNHKSEWMFVYMYYLDILIKEISKTIDVNTWYDDGTIDWSCATITRGFAIPYNESGVVDNHYFDREDTISYNTKEELTRLASVYVYGYWEKQIADKFLHNVGIRKYKEGNFINTYNVDKIEPEKASKQSGERFNYNWRLKCVTTLMGLYNGDKDLVREACKYIYSYIEPYKNHTYREMLTYELEQKIFRNGNFGFTPFPDIINDLNEYFGFNISKHLKFKDDICIPEMLDKNI